MGKNALCSIGRQIKVRRLEIKKTSAPEIVDRILRESTPASQFVFDCDGTLIKGDIASLTAWVLLRLGLAQPELLPPEWDDFKEKPFDYSEFRKLRKIIIEKKGTLSVYEWEGFLHSGLPPATSQDAARFAVQEGLKSGSLEFTGALSELAKTVAQQAWIVSGSPDICVWAIGECLKIPPQKILATKFETVDGIYAARIHPPGVIWEGLKRKILEDHGVPDPYFVAGDTTGDWDMMEISKSWVWAVIWGKHRDRGEEFLNHIRDHLKKSTGEDSLPQESGLYYFQEPSGLKRKWVLEVRDGKAIGP